MGIGRRHGERAERAQAPVPRALLGLLGHPIRHSASPAMHEAAAASVGIDARYHLIDLGGADRAALVQALEGVRRLGFAGVNVTFPYKEAVVGLLDALSPEARAVGAVNTVVVRDGRLTGHNTDFTGFRAALTRAIGPLPPVPVALIGAGGVGKAAAFALTEIGAPALHLYDRVRAQAERLAAALGDRVPCRICDDVEAALDDAGGLVNGTPIGMLPNTDSPVPVRLLHADLWVADAVYWPLWTPLLRAARQAGARVMTGRELAIDQAVDAFRLFLEREPARDTMAHAFDRAIEQRAASAS
jgi:shikimate dehydrogenase